MKMKKTKIFIALVLFLGTVLLVISVCKNKKDISNYELQEEHITVEVEGLERAYKIAWVSDLHMISDTEPAEDVAKDQIETIRSRYESMFVTKEGIMSRELWPKIVAYLNENEFDAVILGGDIMDYCSRKNLDAFNAYYEQIKPPVMYIRSDHDYGWWYSGETMKKTDAMKLHAAQIGDKDDMASMRLDFEGFTILGINRSCWNMSPKYLKWFKKQYQQAADGGKKVIIATHVPYESKVDESLQQFSMETRNKIYYWGGEDYMPNEITGEFLDFIYAEDTAVSQILAGHMHASWDGAITNEVSQHIFSPAYEGCIGVISVVPKEKLKK